MSVLLLRLLVGAILLFGFSANGYSICCNPQAYVGRLWNDPWGGFPCQRISFVKVFTICCYKLKTKTTLAKSVGDCTDARGIIAQRHSGDLERE